MFLNAVILHSSKHNNTIQCTVRKKVHVTNYYTNKAGLSKHVRIRIHKTIILSIDLYGCETWFMTLREGHRLKVFETRVLRRIFGLRGMK
jgi:hypothetical protein